MKLLLLGLAKSTISALRYLLAERKSQIADGDSLVAKISEFKVSEFKPREAYEPALIAGFEAEGVIFQFRNQEDLWVTKDFLRDVDLVLTSPGIPPSSPMMQLLATKSIITDLDLFIQSIDTNYVAITGTNGKTTTTSLVAHIFGTEPLGNIGKPLMDYKPKATQEECLALELSSFQIFYSKLDFKKTAKALAHLNLSPDHQDWHSSPQEYIEAKEKLFWKTLEQNLETAIVLNYDDSYTREFGFRLALRYGETWAQGHLRYFSILEDLSKLKYSHRACLRGDELCLYSLKDLKLRTQEQNLVGTHNYSNILAAMLLADAVNVSCERIVERIKSFQAVAHRMEYVLSSKGKTFYNDSKATNPESSDKAFRSFDQSIAIVGGKDKKLDMGLLIEVLLRRAIRVICIGEIQEQLYEALLERGHPHVYKARDLESAVQMAWGFPESLPVLFSPATSSFDMFLNYEDRGEQYKTIVRKLAVS